MQRRSLVPTAIFFLRMRTFFSNMQTKTFLVVGKENRVGWQRIFTSQLLLSDLGIAGVENYMNLGS